MSDKAVILRIERISLNDGKGMRTVVFFKGCHLHCAWCSTPESQKLPREVYYKKERCRSCGACILRCPEQALAFSEDGKIIRDQKKCRNCFRCVDVCNFRAQQIYGREMTVEEVMKEIRKDEIFYFFSDGGVTLSGGDVFCQTDFVEALLDECIDSGIDTCAELDLYTEPENVKRIIPKLDMVYADIKCMSPTMHKKWTGGSNEKILSNLKLADEICRENAIHIRVPVVEGVNDTAANILATAEFCANMKNCAELEFLPYHRLGIHAYRQLQRPYPLEDRKPMNRFDVYERMGFLCDREWPFDIRISGMDVYSRKTGKIEVTEEELKA